MITHTSRGLKQDIKRRSKENHERGRGARKIGNPRYKPVKRRDKNDVLRKLYILRSRKWELAGSREFQEQTKRKLEN